MPHPTYTMTPNERLLYNELQDLRSRVRGVEDRVSVRPAPAPTFAPRRVIQPDDDGKVHSTIGRRLTPEEIEHLNRPWDRGSGG